jgi:hypothetical protein
MARFCTRLILSTVWVPNNVRSDILCQSNWHTALPIAEAGLIRFRPHFPPLVALDHPDPKKKKFRERKKCLPHGNQEVEQTHAVVSVVDGRSAVPVGY